MKKEKIYEWEILVPCANNYGEEINIDHHRMWDKWVQDISGGLTIYKSAKGTWIFNSRAHEERMIPVRFFATRKQLKNIMEFTAKHYKQLAVKVALISKEVIIKHYKGYVDGPLKGWTSAD